VSRVAALRENVVEHVVDETLYRHAAMTRKSFEAPNGAFVDGPAARKIAFHGSPPTPPAGAMRPRATAGRVWARGLLDYAET